MLPRPSSPDHRWIEHLQYRRPGDTRASVPGDVRHAVSDPGYQGVAPQTSSAPQRSGNISIVTSILNDDKNSRNSDATHVVRIKRNESRQERITRLFYQKKAVVVIPMPSVCEKFAALYTK